MPARNVVYPDSYKSKFDSGKKGKDAGERKLTPVQKTSDERKKHRYRRCLVGACVALAIITAILLAGLLPALIISATNSATSGTTSGSANTGGSSVNNSTGTNVSNTTSSSSISSISSTVSVVTTGPSASTSTSANVVTTGFSASMSTSATVVTTGSSASMSTSATGFTASGTVTSSTTAFYGYEDVSLSCSVNLVNITIVITVQKTVNATFNNFYSTFWSGVLNQTYIDTGSQIIYTWTIVTGQTVQATGNPYVAEAQFHLFGVNQTTSADLFSVTATTVTGVTSSVSGHF